MINYYTKQICQHESGVLTENFNFKNNGRNSREIIKTTLEIHNGYRWLRENNG